MIGVAADGNPASARFLRGRRANLVQGIDESLDCRKRCDRGPRVGVAPMG